MPLWDQIYHEQQLLGEGTNILSDDRGSLEVLQLESESIAQISVFGFAMPKDNSIMLLGIFRKIWALRRIRDPFYRSFVNGNR
ncbi:hypothetical protein SBOR_0222 [Sclerotinia borealis F-4128]|uniref:Uncharacterized protein n=1 Tax=Sclerotinia borealis (strain F-4128) TaxID=1432307 RepID=W9CXV9_SCLBF|nr:hypothetical protein SBOR_0222 [Sclerotinia borealis F-4128]